MNTEKLENKYFIIKNGKIIGPFKRDIIVDLYLTKSISINDKVRKENESQWIELKNTELLNQQRKYFQNLQPQILQKKPVTHKRSFSFTALFLSISVGVFLFTFIIPNLYLNKNKNNFQKYISQQEKSLQNNIQRTVTSLANETSPPSDERTEPLSKSVDVNGQFILPKGKHFFDMKKMEEISRPADIIVR